ncbi:hypothetical protein [Streptomyces sp. NPDC090029]|uniref:hypothetical protein n=1 Tax=Streptomyces sp. NPDC090029 TaxID=3365924 RepID=UPI003821C131
MARLESLRSHSLAGRVSAVALVLSYALLTVGVALKSMPVFLGAIVAGYVLELALPYVHSSALSALRRIQFGLSARFLLRQILLLGFLAYTGLAAQWVSVALVGALLVLFNAQLAYGVGMAYIKRKHRALPVTARALDLGLSIPSLPPDMFYRRYARKLQFADAPAMLGALLSVVLGAEALGLAGAAATTLFGLVAVAAVFPYAMRVRRMPTREEVLEAANRAIDLHRPRVGVYFSFASVGKDFMYQVNMWLETLEELEQPSLIILRERRSMSLLTATTVPVICVPKADDLADLALPDMRVVLYPGNAGKNVHMLQRAEMKHVFIGHGDSDKLASSNRASKTYDEIWVAGEAGRARYARLRGAVSDEAIVEVGRPQVASVEQADGQAKEHPTILYAPTWEGWTSDNDYTSVTRMGVALVKRLMELNPRGRIIYRPHPLLGHRSPEAAAAHREILALLQEDNLRRHRDLGVPEPDPQMLRRMGELKEHIDALLSRSPDSPAHHLSEQERVVQVREAYARWDECYRVAYSEQAHFVSTGRLPTLIDCFNASAAMISDVSSVVSDFVASGKPFALGNPQGLDEAEFLRQNTAAGAAFILTEDLTAVDQLWEAVRAPESDPLREARTVLRTFLLGEDYQASPELFRKATTSLLARAEALFPPGSVAEPIIPSLKGRPVLEGQAQG